MTATTIIVVVTLGCCCLLNDAYVFRSGSGNNHYNEVNLSRQSPGYARQIIYKPTHAPQRNVLEPTQVNLVAPTRQVPRTPTVRNVIPQAPRSRNIYRPVSRAQNVHAPSPRARNVYPQTSRARRVHPPAPRAQNVYPETTRARRVHPPAPRAQNVYRPAPRSQYVYPQPSRVIKVSPPAPQDPIYSGQLRPSGPHRSIPTVYERSRNTQPDYTGVNRQSDYYRSQVDQEYDAHPFRASRRNIIRRHPFPQNTIIIIKEDSPNSRGTSAPSQVHGPVVPVPASSSARSSSPVLAPAANAEASPQVPNAKPNADKATSATSQDRYYENMMRLSMLAEMELPHYGGHNSLYQLAKSLGAPESQTAAQSQESKSALPPPSSPLGAQGANHKEQLDRLYSLHLAEALDLPDVRAPGASSASSNANGPPANRPNKATSLEPVDSPTAQPPSASGAAIPTAEPAASLTDPAAYPAGKPAAVPSGSQQYSQFDLYLREALDLPVAG